MASSQQTMTASKSKSPGGFWDLEEQFAFYGQYHANKTNVLIHIFCVPTIFWTSLVLFNSLFPWHTTIPLIYGPLKTDVILNVPFLTALGYAAYFVGLEPIAGSIYAPFVIFLGWSANEFYANNANSTRVAGVVFVAAWIAQFIGHGKFEGRAPALLDSLFQSLVLAVFFVFMEVMFELGYKPELHRRLQNRIGKEIVKYRAKKRMEGKVDDKATAKQTVFRG